VTGLKENLYKLFEQVNDKLVLETGLSLKKVGNKNFFSHSFDGDRHLKVKMAIILQFFLSTDFFPSPFAPGKKFYVGFFFRKQLWPFPGLRVNFYCSFYSFPPKTISNLRKFSFGLRKRGREDVKLNKFQNCHRHNNRHVDVLHAGNNYNEVQQTQLDETSIVTYNEKFSFGFSIFMQKQYLLKLHVAVIKVLTLFQ
jgi:hypothetical protein